MTYRQFCGALIPWSLGLAGLAGFADAPAAYEWKLPSNFRRPRVPASNPMSAAKAELGRHLFYDPRLSANDHPSKRGGDGALKKGDAVTAVVKATEVMLSKGIGVRSHAVQIDSVRFESWLHPS
jgi:cytochrome c peroxidase